MNTPNNSTNQGLSQEEALKASFKVQKRKRVLRLSLVTLALVFSVGAWYYTHYRVPAPLLQKFVLINSALEHSLINYKKKCDYSLRTLKRNVKKDGNRKEGIELIKRAELLKKKTADITSEIARNRQLLIAKAGGGLDKETHTVKRTEAKLRVSQLMVGILGSPKGEGYVLEKRLNDYSSWLNQDFKDLLKKPLPSLTKGADNFVYDNFWQTPVVVALAKLSQLQHQVITHQLNVLNLLHAQQPESTEIRFDKIYTGVSAESNVLKSGDTYRATMMIAAIPSKLKATMTVNGKPIKVENGIGKVRFKTTYPLGRKYWEGTVTFKSKGRDTTFRVKEEYIVIPRMK